MAVTVYRSTDASAPTVSGTIGSLITLLDACLINGYGTMSPAGWTKPYSTTNVGVYRMAQTTSPATGMFLRVDDTVATAARVRGYSSISSSDDDGVNPFPNNAQVSGGLYMKKSATADATTRPWILLADTRGFYLFIFTNQTVFGGSSTSGDSQMFFGDLISNSPNDLYDCMIIAQNSNATTTGTLGWMDSSTATTNGHFLARSYTGLGGSTTAAKTRRCSVGITGGTTLGPAVSNAYPDLVTGGINLFSIEILDGPSSPGANWTFRGILPGIYEPYGGTNVGSAFDTFAGSGNLAGKNFLLVPVTSTSTAGRAALQYDGTWY